jgi:hypothetical protein
MQDTAGGCMDDGPWSEHSSVGARCGHLAVPSGQRRAKALGMRRPNPYAVGPLTADDDVNRDPRTGKGHTMQGQNTTGYAPTAWGRRTRLAILGIGAFALVLSGCGPTSEVDQIARDACDMLEAALEGDLEAFAGLEALDRRVDEAGISDEEMERALEDQCGDLLDGPGF